MTGLDPTLLLPGQYAAVYFADGTGQSIPQEPMEEISDVENGNPRYTVYQITDEDKQALDPATTPVFEKQVHGEGAWADISSSVIREIQYPGARVVLETPINNDDVVRLKTGKYLVKTQIWGALSTKIADKNIMKDVTPLGASAKRNFPVLEEHDISLDIFLNKECAQLVANDITLTHQKGGTDGNAITYSVTNPGEIHTLSIAVVANDISVTLGYAAGAVTSTNQDVIDIINGSPEVSRLGVVAQCDAGDAASLATAFVSDNLAGGVDPIQYSDKKGLILMLIIYGNEIDNIRWECYGYLDTIDSPLNPEDVVKQSITLGSYGKLYFRPR